MGKGKKGARWRSTTRLTVARLTVVRLTVEVGRTERSKRGKHKDVSVCERILCESMLILLIDLGVLY